MILWDCVLINDLCSPAVPWCWEAINTASLVVDVTLLHNAAFPVVALSAAVSAVAVSGGGGGGSVVVVAAAAAGGRAAAILYHVRGASVG